MSRKKLINEAIQHNHDSFWYIMRSCAENIEDDERLKKVLTDLRESTKKSAEEHEGNTLGEYYKRLLSVLVKSIKILEDEE
jgi:uncharacterized protein (DUF924 family)